MGYSFLCSLLGVKLVLRQLLIDSHKIEQTYALVTSLNTAKKYELKTIGICLPHHFTALLGVIKRT